MHHKTHGANAAIGAEVRAWLGRRSMTQSALADILGYTQPQVSRRLKGLQPFRVDELLTITTHMNITLGQLLGDELVNEKNPHLVSGEGSSGRTSDLLVAGDGFEPSTSGL